MLDDVKEIEETDKSNMKELLFEFPHQCRQAVELGGSLRVSQKLFQDKDKLMICGLGGSAIGGDILKTLLSHQIKVPIFVNRN
ncbi:MAG: bifunctional phosphoglucose/phosphomannose isomerase, partial [Candidatus Aerophobetes bacterium]|nr:bifunctional phosphoglucose/phosphomannose isomerase [Candidatus Aerophobetes bacterium]